MTLSTYLIILNEFFTQPCCLGTPFQCCSCSLILFCACSTISLTILFWGDVSSCCHLSASGYVNSSHPWEEEIAGAGVPLTALPHLLLAQVGLCLLLWLAVLSRLLRPSPSRANSILSVDCKKSKEGQGQPLNGPQVLLCLFKHSSSSVASLIILDANLGNHRTMQKLH